MTSEPRISTKRLRAAITKVNNARKFGIGLPTVPGECPHGSSMEQRQAWIDSFISYRRESQLVSAKRATILYSLRSHLRGRLHITHQYVQETTNVYTGATKEVCYKRTMEDQAKLVEDAMAEFQMTPEELALDQELRAKRIALYGPIVTKEMGC